MMKRTDDLKKTNAEERLRRAAKQGDCASVSSLIKEGVDVNTQNAHGETALHLAASYNHKSIVRFLLDSGADVDAQDKYGNTALHKAAFMAYTSIVRCLIEAGADPTCRDTRGRTPRDLLPEQDPVLLALLTPDHTKSYNLPIKGAASFCP